MADEDPPETHGPPQVQGSGLPRRPATAGEPDGEPEGPTKDEPAISAAMAARRAAAEVAALTHRDPESVISIERAAGRWRIGVEVVETHRIPDSADILAVYEVQLQPDGTLYSYHRVRRYARGQLHGGHK